MVKEKDENIFWVLSKSIGCIVIIFLILWIPYQIGKANAEDLSQQNVLQIVRVPTEPCEYKTDDFYYKGSCDATDTLLRLDEREYLEKKRIGNAWEKFHENLEEECINYIQNNIQRLKD